MNASRLALAHVASVALVATLAACAPRTPPATATTAPRFPEFVYPALDPTLSPDLAERQREAWGWLQAGELRRAERTWSGLLRAAPETAAALAGMGYVTLARDDAEGALARFDEALGADPQLAAAHAGRGHALLQLERPAEAASAFEAAQAADPKLDYSGRIAALRFRGTQAAVARARMAAAEGQWESATVAYQQALAASPESAFLLRELAAVERRSGRTEDALAHITRAIELDPADRAAYVTLGELREEAGDLEGAVRAYEAARTLEPGGGIEERLAALRDAVELARLPEQYRSIVSQEAVTRGETAALFGVRLDDLLSTASTQSAPVVTDGRDHWATDWILGVMRAGVMQPFANHTFQPDLPMSRGDFAQAVARILELIAAQHPGEDASWREARHRFTDLLPGHPVYQSASIAAAAGILPPTSDGAFEPTRPVTGAEAVEAVNRLRRLAGPAKRSAQRP